MSSSRFVVNLGFCVRLLKRHASVHVRQMEGSSGGTDSNRIICVEGKEPNARFSIFRNIGPDIEFKELTEPRDGRATTGGSIRH